MIAKILFLIARLPVTGWLVGWIFAYMSFAIPVHRLRDTATLMAFHHPKPSYPVHILIVPKRMLAGMADLTSDHADFTADLFSTVQSLVAEFALEAPGYRLICNGGAYQDVPHLHFHLVSGL